MRTFQVLSELLAKLAEMDTEFILVHDMDLARALGETLKQLEEMAKTWAALSDDEKLKAAIEAAAWKKLQSGTGEYVPIDAIPTLAKLLKERQRVAIGPHNYVLSRDGQRILRFPRGDRR